MNPKTITVNKLKQVGEAMNTSFFERKEQNEVVENKLEELKKEYQRPQMSQPQVEALRAAMEKAAVESTRSKTGMVLLKAAATAAVAAFLILPNVSANVAYAMEKIPFLGQLVEVVTFRDYEYSSDRNMAEIHVSELKLDETVPDNAVSDQMEATVEEINTEIRRITEEQIAQFETYLEDDLGYQDIQVKSEVITTTPDYFTLKLFCYQGAGSGYQWNYFYTIDLNTGERLQLKNIFVEGADYITPISDSIKEQMVTQMAEDEMVHYWVNDEIEALNFKSITDETSFYINENNNVVIAFNEGDVAPMYMGAVEFEIPAEVLSDIRK